MSFMYYDFINKKTGKVIHQLALKATSLDHEDKLNKMRQHLAAKFNLPHEHIQYDSSFKPRGI